MKDGKTEKASYKKVKNQNNNHKYSFSDSEYKGFRIDHMNLEAVVNEFKMDHYMK